MVVSLRAPESCVSHLRVLSQGQQKDQTVACGHTEEDGVPGVAGVRQPGTRLRGDGSPPRADSWLCGAGSWSPFPDCLLDHVMIIIFFQQLG